MLDTPPGLADWIGVDMVDATAEERWLPIPGYEGFYEVSDRGRVRSVPRVITRIDGARVPYPGVVLRPKDNGARLAVGLTRDGIPRDCTVHRLVLTTFVGPAPGGTECCHWDDDHTNNRLTNLRWASHVANADDSLRNGTNHNATRTTCPRDHPLFQPNLVAGLARAGIRKCLACSRAMTMAAMRIREGAIGADELDFQALADTYYAEVVATGGRPRVRSRKRHDIPLPRLSPDGPPGRGLPLRRARRQASRSLDLDEAS